jgi:hypothetical protein
MDAAHLKKYQFKKGHNSAPASGGVKERSATAPTMKGGGKPAPAAAMKVPVLAIQNSRSSNEERAHKGRRKHEDQFCASELRPWREVRS